MKYRLLHGYDNQLVEAEVIELVGYDGLEFNCQYFGICYKYNGYFLYGRAGYAWDGSSIPFKWLLGVFYEVEKYCKVPSLFHDIACQAMRAGKIDLKYKDYFDRLYRDMMIDRGMGKGQAGRRYWAVKNFGLEHCRPQPEKRGKIIEVA